MNDGDLLITNKSLGSRDGGCIPKGSVGILLNRRKDWFQNYEIIYYVYILGTVQTISSKYVKKMS
jgi:hypothetical protein|tara:strand:- start:402 stop:596 length:195 start_codon:yes stop_codon:yes gene_type:complete